MAEPDHTDAAAASSGVALADPDAPAAETAEVPTTDDPSPEDGPPKPTRTALRTGALAAILIVLAMAALAATMGYQARQARNEARTQDSFVEAARQGALNLANIDWTRVDQDVQRINDSSTGAFLADFQQRSAGFIDFVRQAKSKSQATIREAGLESVDGDQARVVVAMAVDVDIANSPPDQAPRSWRMRITVQKMPDQSFKMSNVEFVS